MIRILLVDDQAIVREGVRSMLSLEADMAVVGEAANGRDAVALARQLAPDVILLDIRMPGMDGLSALPQIKQVAAHSSVIMVTLYDDPDYLMRAVASGAAGYILKDTTREDLVASVRAVAEGGAIIEPGILSQLLARMRSGAAPAPLPPAAEAPHAPTPAPAVALTEREIEVLRLVADGLTNTQIGEALFISPTTVKTHVQNITQKLGVSDRTQAAVAAVRMGLI